MKKYLEFKNEKSSKFWEIDIQGQSFTTRYGKIGSKGSSKTKSFDDHETATKEGTKLLKQKFKKGYIEKSLDDSVAIKTTLLSFKEAAKKYDQDYNTFEVSAGNDSVIVIEGDTIMTENFADWYKREIKTLGIGDDGLVIINGNLTVIGDVAVSAFILVLGDLTCDYLFSGDFNIHVTGGAYIKYALFGQYNDGVLNIDGTTHVPFLVNSDHCMNVHLVNTITFYIFGSESSYDFGQSDLASIGLDYVVDEDGDVDVERFVNIVRSGKSPFKNIPDSEMTLNFEKSAFLKKIRI